MTQVSHSTIRSIAQSVGITHLMESLFPKITNSTQYFINSIIEESKQLALISKRKKITINDINSSLEINNFQPLFGYTSIKDLKYINLKTSEGMDLLGQIDYNIEIDNNFRQENLRYPISTRYIFNWIAQNGNSIEDSGSNELNESDNNESIHLNSTKHRTQLDTDIFPSSNRHSLSNSHQVFFRTSRDHLLSEDIEKKENIFEIFRSKPFLKTLIPYYIKFSTIQLRDFSESYDHIYISLSIIRSLVQNEEIPNIFNYMHEIISLCISFLISQFIKFHSTHQIIQIRDFAGEFLQVLCERVWKDYPMIQPRIVEQLLYFLLNNESNISEKYGAFIGLSNLDLFTISNYILPYISILNEYVKTAFISGERNTRYIGIVMLESIIKTIGLCIHSDSFKSYALGFPITNPTMNLKNYNEISKLYGSNLLPFYIDDSSLLYL